MHGEKKKKRLSSHDKMLFREIESFEKRTITFQYCVFQTVSSYLPYFSLTCELISGVGLQNSHKHLKRC